ncbi:MAG TPA: acetate--CoA ligase family protein [Bauldia sp.]|nr:acetate--CoA ligase family protein [Bauldia sp.]
MAAVPLSRALLAPRSVAIVGASDDVTKTGARPQQFLKAAGFAGKVYPINPRRETVLGDRAWPSIAALPEVPDHAFVVTPVEAAVAAVEACAAAGVGVVTLLASGFSEAGPEGLAREAQLRDILRGTATRLVGPSSLGVIDFRSRLILTANAALAEGDFPVGGIFVASQSGSMIGALASRGKPRGIGFAALVSVGNEVDLGVGEICAATLDDASITGYALFLETIRKSTALRAFAVEAARRGKPVVAYKLGRSAEAAELAVSHTGALAGEDDVADAFFADCGIARVDTLEGLLEVLPLARRLAIRPANAAPAAVGVLTTTGGGAAMVVDQLAVNGVKTVPATPGTLAELSARGVTAAPARIVDLTLAGARYEPMKAALDTLLAAPEFDMLAAVIGSSARQRPVEATRPLIDSANSAKPVVAFVVPDAPEALALLTAAGIPNFRTPESCGDAVAAVLRRRPARAAAANVAEHLRPAGMLNELDAYALFEKLGVAHAPAVALDVAALDRAGPGPRLPFAYPVAAKLLSAEIAHKSDVGGVVLDIADATELRAAAHHIAASVAKHRPGLPVDRILVQQMSAGVGEVLVGYRFDAQVGPVVMLAMGGVLTEIYRDRALRLAPVDIDGARAMIAEVKGLAALAGYRGKPRGDLDALANLIVACSHLADLTSPPIFEAELNPVIVRAEGEGVVAVDAVVRLGEVAPA